MPVPGQKRSNGLYLGKFEDKDEAIDYINMLARKYQYTPNPHKMSLRYLCRFAKNEGVDIYLNQLSTWFKEMGIKIRDVRPKPKTKDKITFSIDKNVIEYLKDYPNQSYLTELGLKLVMGIPTEDIIVYLPANEGEENVNVIFKKNENKIKAIATGKLKERDKRMISGLIKKAEDKGMKHIKDYATLFGFKWIGGNKNENSDNNS